MRHFPFVSERTYITPPLGRGVRGGIGFSPTVDGPSTVADPVISQETKVIVHMLADAGLLAEVTPHFQPTPLPKGGVICSPLMIVGWAKPHRRCGPLGCVLLSAVGRTPLGFGPPYRGIHKSLSAARQGSPLARLVGAPPPYDNVRARSSSPPPAALRAQPRTQSGQSRRTASLAARTSRAKARTSGASATQPSSGSR